MAESPTELIKGFDFGTLIAFVLPGIVSTRALAYYLPTVQRAIDKASTGGEGVTGPLIWLLFIAATSGLTVSVVRQQWFDPLCGFIYGLFRDRPQGSTNKKERVQRPHWRSNYAAIRDKKCEVLFDKAVANVYRYYQFISNMGLALLLLGLARRNNAPLSDNPEGIVRQGQITFGVFVASGFLIVTAYQQFKGWCRVHSQLTSD